MFTETSRLDWEQHIRATLIRSRQCRRREISVGDKIEGLLLAIRSYGQNSCCITCKIRQTFHVDAAVGIVLMVVGIT